MLEIEPVLFPNNLFPDFLERESLYSWCGRVHQLSCNSSSHRTSVQLFGNSKSGLRVDFPTPLKTLRARVGSILGDIDSLLKNHTMFGFYEKFLPRERRDELAYSIEQGPYSRVHYALGLSASLSPLHRNLRCCRICLAESREATGGWWKTDEQWPAKFVCWRHDRLLDSVDIELLPKINKEWLLPGHVFKAEGPRSLASERTGFLRLRVISQWCEDILSSRGLALDTRTLRYCYLMEAKERGFLSMDGALRLSSLRDDWLEWSGDLPMLMEFSFVRDVGGINGGFIGQLMRSYPGIRHPLKHFLLMAYFFESFTKFKTRNESVSRILDQDGEASLQNHLRDLRARLRILVDDEKFSVSAAAANVGVSPSQAIKYLNKIDSSYARRPRIVGTEKEEQLIDLLERGICRKKICEELNIRSSFIKDYLAGRVDLRSLYQLKNFSNKREKYRAKFEETMNGNTSLTFNDIKKLPNSGYQWLHKHDAEWLRGAFPSLWN